MAARLRLVHDAASAPLRLARVLVSDESVGLLPAPFDEVRARADRPMEIEVSVSHGETAPGERFTVTLRSRLGPFQEPDAVTRGARVRQWYLPPGPGRHDLVYDVVVEHWVEGHRGPRSLRRREFVGTVPVQVDA